MWRCPDCETINTTDKCVVCGNTRIISQKSSVKQNNHNLQDCLKNTENSIDNHQNTVNGQVITTKQNVVPIASRKKRLYIASAAVVFIAIALGATAFFSKDDNSAKADVPEIKLNLNDNDTITIISENAAEKTTEQSIATSASEKSVMPCILNLSLEDAEKLLVQLNLEYEVTYSPLKYVNINSGCVYSQSPDSGTELEDGTIVKIGISTFQDDVVGADTQLIISENQNITDSAYQTTEGSYSGEISVGEIVTENDLPASEITLPEIKDHIVIRDVEYSIYDEELFLGAGSTAEDIVDLDKMTCLKNLLIKPYDGGCVVVEYDGERISDLKTIRNLTSLEQLGVIWTDISNVNDLANLYNLHHLELGHNKIESIGALGNLHDLEYLSLCDNQISDINSIRSLTKLEYLDLSNNPIKSLDALSNLTNLKTLHIGNYSSSLGAYLKNAEVECFSDISALKNLKELNTLSIYNTRTLDISSLGGLSSLEYLYLNGNEIHNLESLFALSQLKELNVSDNSITDISGIGSLTNLEGLWLSGNNITDYSELCSLTNLKRLSIEISGSEDIDQVMQLTCLSNLEYLSIEMPNENRLTDEEVQLLKEAFDCSVGFCWRN